MNTNVPMNRIEVCNQDRVYYTWEMLDFIQDRKKDLPEWIIYTVFSLWVGILRQTIFEIAEKSKDFSGAIAKGEGSIFLTEELIPVSATSSYNLNQEEFYAQIFSGLGAGLDEDKQLVRELLKDIRQKIEILSNSFNDRRHQKAFEPLGWIVQATPREQKQWNVAYKLTVWDDFLQPIDDLQSSDDED